MNTRWIVPALVFGAAGLMATIGCDDKPNVPAQVLQQQAKAAEEQKHPNKHPTTQELISGKRSRTALIPLPLTMELPPGWGKLNEVSDAGLKLNAGNLLQGYTPNGEVQIQLSARPAMKKEDLNHMLAAGKKEMAEKPQQILKFELRPLGNNQVLERQSVGRAAPLTVYDANNQPHTSEESIFNWTISVLVPNEEAFQVYELNFILLTKSQYDKDKDFLNSVVETLRYATDTSPTPAPSALPAATTLP